MIHLIGNAPVSPHYREGTWEEFTQWIRAQRFYQLDIETDVTPYFSTRRIITIQFGSHDGSTQWVLQLSFLSPFQLSELRRVLEDDRQTKLAHNAAFECITLRFWGVRITNVYDTMLMEKVLNGGLHDDEATYSLADLSYRYLGMEMDKTEQTSFGDDILTESKVIYAATDVQPLGAIYRMQVPMLGHLDLDWVGALENEVLIAYSEMTYYGLELDTDMWRQNIALAQPLVDSAKGKLDAWLRRSPFREKAEELGYISSQDRVQIKWTAPKQREYLLQLLIPDIGGASLGVVRKYIKDYPNHSMRIMLQEFVDKNYTTLQQMLVASHRNELIDMGLLVPADTVTINWNSVAQVLPVFQVVEKQLKDLSKESLAKTTHPVIIDYREYKDTTKLLSSYGEEFIAKFVEPDGKVRTRYNQVVSTGRVSSQSPNMQNIPAKEAVGNRYRNCFMAPQGWKFVDSDYSSQELCIIAFLSKDPVWNEALRKGQDLHSVCAELVYGRKWKEGAILVPTKVTKDGKEKTIPACAYYQKNDKGEMQKQKCDCPKHKSMRTGVKTINFGLAYGMSAFKLSGTLSISLKEAEALIEDYFKAFPKIKALLEYLGRFGVLNGYSRTMAPFFRKRWYPYWQSASRQIEPHIMGIQYNGTLGAIERASKNAPIQGTGADQIKLSTVLIMWYIYDNGLDDRIRLAVQVHDQNTTMAKDEITEWWKVQMTSLMEEAATVSITNGLLKSETNITDRWSK